MTNNQLRKRLNALFADLEKLADAPPSQTASIRREIDELRERLHELETAVRNSEKRAVKKEKAAPVPAPAPAPVVKEPEQKPRRSVPALYETERMGFMFTGDVLQPIQGRSSDLSNTLDGIIVPLTVSGQDIGKMQVQPSRERAWTQEETNLLNAVASRASTQIQNLRLLEATERARAEAEAATRRFMHENWESYLDGINQSERIGYAYDQNSVNQFIEPPAMDGGIRQTVNVMEEHVGTLYVQPNPDRPTTNEDRVMVESIARQIAQQVENIRLLADATRARAEAEAATRSLTHENWEAYAASKGQTNLGFVYDSNRVIPLSEIHPGYGERNFKTPDRPRRSHRTSGDLGLEGDPRGRG